MLRALRSTRDVVVERSVPGHKGRRTRPPPAARDYFDPREVWTFDFCVLAAYFPHRCFALMFMGEPKLPAVDRCASGTRSLIQGQAVPLHAVIAAADAGVLERGYEEILVPTRGIPPLHCTLRAAAIGRQPINGLDAKRVRP